MTFQQFGKKLAASGSRVALVETINHYFDGLYVPAILMLGPIVGGMTMMVSAIILNYIFVRAYNGSPHDWYGFEWIRSKIGTGAVMKIIALPYLLFWCWWDPFAGFIFIRGKQDTNFHFKFSDWLLLAGITIFGSFVWTAMIWSGIESVKKLFF